ncbi:MAG: DUF2332 domain-containing protein, partial [Yonghaparkia sp.]|nr:DUF2332 domain-containing protein [Microcella sp.]
SACAQAPAGATLVVASPAVLVYLSPADRARFASAVGELAHHWISLDGRAVLPDLAAAAETVLPGEDGDFLLSRDGEPLAVVSPHGERIERWVASQRGWV